MFRLFIKFYFILFVGVLLYLLFGVVSQHTWLKDRLEEDRVNDLVGTIYLLEKAHQNLGDATFKNILTTYPKESNIPVIYSDINELNLSNRNKNMLRKGEYVTNRDLVTYETAKNIGIYYNFPKSDLVIEVGPLGRGEELDDIVKFYERSILLVVALPMIFIMISLLSKLKHLEKAATSFGNGNFNFRVSEQKNHRIGNLNQSFNRMAARVEHLIKGHKELSNAVAHELRTPISRIRFELDMMQLEQDEKIRNEYMYGISENIDELADLVDELLTYARFDRDITGLELKPHSLAKSLQKVIDARHFDSDKQCNYDNSWMKTDTAAIDVGFDPKHLERAIGNLVTNAEKYSKSKIQITVEQHNNLTTIYIDDDGPGIPVNERIDIFTPFKRLDTSRTRTTGGFGLGLAIVKQIAQWHGGDVVIEDSLLGGARFIFSWPT